MRILLLSSAFSGLTQRFFTELEDAAYTVSVELHHGNIPLLLEGVELFKPDLIICPFLTQKIPAEIYENYTCLIVHPGIEGDRGASSLDWAIQNDKMEWGVTLLEAQEEMDMGDIWAKRTFPLRKTTKSSLFNREVTQGAIDCLWDVLSYFDVPSFKPTALDYNNPLVQGKLLPTMKQKDRKIHWKKQKTDEILKRLHAADGSPGVLDQIYGQSVFLYNVHKEENLKGNAGDIIATANHAICRATIDGAIWIGHLKPKLVNGEKGVKLPSTFVLAEPLAAANSPTFLNSLFSKPVKNINIDYTQEGQQLPCQEVWYTLERRVAYLYFSFHNGGMSTTQCELLLSVYQHVSTLDIDVIVLMGGQECWSNGIHLNNIEVADNPARESWFNINAIDDLILQIITTLDKVTISAVAGGAGAGGAILAIATDKTFVREGVILNPHYKNMGQLFGSEYWTYLLPKRVGDKMANILTEEQRLPISAKKAWRLGLIDKVLDKNHGIFNAQIKHLANTYVANQSKLEKILADKSATRCFDEAKKPLALYRQYELTQMYSNFYVNNAYHHARKNFVYKISDHKTPENIALHRQIGGLRDKTNFDNIFSFVWQKEYELGNDLIDSQHKYLFNLAESLIASHNKEELLKNIQHLYKHVKDHLSEEEALMKKLSYQGYSEHNKEHNLMMKKLIRMDHKITDDDWSLDEVREFVEDWGRHIIQTDMAFNAFIKQRQGINP